MVGEGLHRGGDLVRLRASGSDRVWLNYEVPCSIQKNGRHRRIGWFHQGCG